MTDKITPEFLAKMHAALRGVKHGSPQRYMQKKKSSIVNPSLGNASLSSSNTPLPAGSGLSGGAPSVSKVDTPLAESVAQTTAEVAVDMAKETPQADKLKAEAAGANSGAEAASGGEGELNLMNEILANEVHEVETALLHPLLDKAVPPPIENGVWEIKDTHGKLIQRTPYVNGKIQGEVQFFNEMGELIQTYEAVNGIKHGVMRYYDGVGRVTHEVPYVKDKREGKGTFWVNGIKTAEIHFHLDAMEGPAIYYASEGYISAAALYHQNALEGEMRCFDAYQRLIKTLTYAKGQLNGESVTYYPGGAKVFERMTYLQNVPHDKQAQFYENGNLLSFREYDKGKLLKEKFFDSKGKEISKPEGEKIINLFPHIPNYKV